MHYLKRHFLVLLLICSLVLFAATPAIAQATKYLEIGEVFTYNDGTIGTGGPAYGKTFVAAEIGTTNACVVSAFRKLGPKGRKHCYQVCLIKATEPVTEIEIVGLW